MKTVITHLVAVVLSAFITLNVFVNVYGTTSSPTGQHCWNEINKTQPMGIEKICEEN